jgi:hypothetical protein
MSRVCSKYWRIEKYVQSFGGETWPCNTQALIGIINKLDVFELDSSYSGQGQAASCDEHVFLWNLKGSIKCREILTRRETASHEVVIILLTNFST